MKELTIEQKAKRYDEALEKARDLYLPSDSALLEEIFPELIENDDEKVRGAIIHFISHTPTVPKGRINKETMLAWLEKQKLSERNSDWSNEDERIRKALINGFNKLDKSALWYNGITNGQILAWLEKQESYYTFEIKEGHWYKCVCDYMLNGSDLMFKNDRLYYCRRNWRLRGEIDERNVKDIGINGYKSFFRPATNQEIKDWLEKQKAVDILDEEEREFADNVDSYRKEVDAAYQKGYNEGVKATLEKQDEQKPQGKSALEATKEEKVDDSNKVEPKFEVGKWIVWQDKCYKVKDNSCGYKLLDQDGFITSLEYGTVDETARFWDITKDAKDGDVLVDAYGNIGVYKSHDEFNWKSYCSLGCNRGFKCFEVEHENDKTYPATKEQLDILTKEWLPQNILLILKNRYKM